MIFGFEVVERRFLVSRDAQQKGRDYHMSDPNAGKRPLPPQLSIPAFASYKSACLHALVLGLLSPNSTI
jgi:hypothetical protein